MEDVISASEMECEDTMSANNVIKSLNNAWETTSNIIQKNNDPMTVKSIYILCIFFLYFVFFPQNRTQNFFAKKMCEKDGKTFFKKNKYKNSFGNKATVA